MIRTIRPAMLVVIVAACALILPAACSVEPASFPPADPVVEAEALIAQTTPTATEQPPQPTSTFTPQPLVPTPLPTLSGSPERNEQVKPGGTASDIPRRALDPVEPESMRIRLGMTVPRDIVPLTEEVLSQLGFGWYLDWGTSADPVLTQGVEFAQMVSLQLSDPSERHDEIARLTASNPGALWIIGNEPDVPWQDNKTPEEYARIYHDYYQTIKSLDPAARVAIGGVSQPTPLRFMYLERILEAYQAAYGEPMPVDVWNVHAFVLREERDSWGVSIPPGIDVQQGILYEIEDHDDMEIFQQQIVDFRRWMARHGQRDKPLIVSEYGILMPEGYGFPPVAVADFMVASFDFLLNASDPEIGYPADDDRLVQRLAWFSLGDMIYPTGNLIDPATGEWTHLGKVFATYAARLDATHDAGMP